MNIWRQKTTLEQLLKMIEKKKEESLKDRSILPIIYDNYELEKIFRNESPSIYLILKYLNKLQGEYYRKLCNIEDEIRYHIEAVIKIINETKDEECCKYDCAPEPVPDPDPVPVDPPQLNRQQDQDPVRNTNRLDNTRVNNIANLIRTMQNGNRNASEEFLTNTVPPPLPEQDSNIPSELAGDVDNSSEPTTVLSQLNLPSMNNSRSDEDAHIGENFNDPVDTEDELMAEPAGFNRLNDEQQDTEDYINNRNIEQDNIVTQEILQEEDQTDTIIENIERQ